MKTFDSSYKNIINKEVKSTVYQCENCNFFYKDSSFITNCVCCGEEICFTCKSSFAGTSMCISCQSKNS